MRNLQALSALDEIPNCEHLQLIVAPEQIALYHLYAVD